MSEAVDSHFYDRADQVIHLANDQYKSADRGKVSASLMYATARFNAWISARGFNDGEEMKASKQETIEYFVTQYRGMLEENLDDYIDNFDRYMGKTET